MSCSRVFYGLMAVLFAYVTVTVAAFKYLEWWQAILASAATLVLLVMGAKLLVKTAIGRVGAMAMTAMGQQSKVLKDAAVDVHTVRPVPPPADLEDDADDPDGDEFDRAEAAADLRTLRWFEVELSVFPDRQQAEPTDPWNAETLVLVPADAKPPQARGLGGFGAGGDTYELRQLRVMVDGEPMPATDELTGPQRLRFTVGVPAGLRELALRYVVHQFGRIRLPAVALPPRGDRP